MAAIEPTANNPQLTFKARRIYVGNLPADPPIDDKQLREFFDQAMRQAGLLDPSNSDGCCVSDVWISAEKQFAFVEVRTVTDANNAMQLDGITLYGQALRVNRPSDYVPPPTAGPGAPGIRKDKCKSGICTKRISRTEKTARNSSDLSPVQ